MAARIEHRQHHIGLAHKTDRTMRGPPGCHGPHIITHPNCCMHASDMGCLSRNQLQLPEFAAALGMQFIQSAIGQSTSASELMTPPLGRRCTRFSPHPPPGPSLAPSSPAPLSPLICGEARKPTVCLLVAIARNMTTVEKPAMAVKGGGWVTS